MLTNFLVLLPPRNISTDDLGTRNSFEKNLIMASFALPFMAAALIRSLILFSLILENLLTLALVCTCNLSSRFPDFHSYQSLFTINIVLITVAYVYQYQVLVEQSGVEAGQV